MTLAKRYWIKFYPGLLSFLVLVLLWEWAARTLSPARLAPPLDVLWLFVKYPFGSKQLAGLGMGGDGSILPHMASTVIRYFIGVITGSVLGIFIGLSMGYSRLLRDYLGPVIEVLRTIPPLALVPFFVMWIGPRPLSQIVMIVVYATLMLTVNTLNAVDNVNPSRINFARTLGASRPQIFKTVIIPAIVPEVIGGIRVVLAFSWGIEVVSELVGTSSGLGKVIMSLIPVMVSGGIIAIVLWIVLIALLTDALFMMAARRITRWKPEEY